jgi:hypothetical protein
MNAQPISKITLIFIIKKQLLVANNKDVVGQSVESCSLQMNTGMAKKIILSFPLEQMDSRVAKNRKIKNKSFSNNSNNRKHN